MDPPPSLWERSRVLQGSGKRLGCALSPAGVDQCLLFLPVPTPITLLCRPLLRSGAVKMAFLGATEQMLKRPSHCSADSPAGAEIFGNTGKKKKNKPPMQRVFLTPGEHLPCECLFPTREHQKTQEKNRFLTPAFCWTSTLLNLHILGHPLPISLFTLYYSKSLQLGLGAR